MIRLSISNLLCGRNAAPPTIANWHADEGTQASCLRRVWRTRHADEEAMMAGLHHTLIRDDSDRFAVTIFVKFAKFVFARKKSIIDSVELEFL